jgi:predicted Fe-Mo cluster-binding NifX family protein
LTDRIIVPTENQEGLNARLAEHFGRAPYYTIVELGENGEVSSVKNVPNVGEHAGGIGFSHDHILDYKPNAIIVYGMGPRGLTSFQDAGAAVLKANANTVGEVITAYKEDKLEELTEGCEHAHHHAEHTHHH